MSFNSSIIAHFGGDTTKLRESTEEASIIMKAFGRQASSAVREIGSGFIGAVVILEAIKGIRELVKENVKGAEESAKAWEDGGKAVTTQEQAWLDLDQGVHGVTHSVGEFISHSLSGWLMVGDAIASYGLKLAGVSKEQQDAAAQSADTTELVLARIKKAHDKYLEELPRKMAETNAKIERLDEEITNSQLSNKDKLSHKEKEIADLKVAMAGMDESTLKYADLEAELKQKTLEAARMATDAAKDQVKLMQESYAINKDSMTLAERNDFLGKQKVIYEKQAAEAQGNVKEAAEYINAANKAGLEIEANTLTIKKATALTETEQLAQFEHKTASLARFNTLTQDQSDLLVIQKNLNENQYKIKEAINNGEAEGTKKQQANLAILINETEELKKQKAEKEAMIKATEDQAAAEAKTLLIMQQQEAEKNARANIGGKHGTPGFAIGALGQNANYFDQGEQARQEALSVQNEKDQDSLGIKSLQNTIQDYRSGGSPTPSTLNLIKKLQGKISDLQYRSDHAYDFIFNPNYSDSIGLGAQQSITPALGSQSQTQVQTTTLQNIQDILTKVFTPK